MKKKLSLPMLMLVCIAASNAQVEQSAACMGLKNPLNFTTAGTHDELWTGYTGSKNAEASTCLTEGASYITVVQAANLESYNNTDGCSNMTYEGAANTTSVDANGQLDYTRQFVIKGAGTDPETHGHLSYLPTEYDTTIVRSIRLGNYCGNHGAEKLTYDIDVTPDNALITIYYAMSLHNGQHSAADNPEFTIVIQTQQGSDWVPSDCEKLIHFRPTPATGQPLAPFYNGSTGLQTGASYGSNIYLPWQKVTINLYSHLYQRIRIKIATGDCSMSAHYCLAYIAGDCQPMWLCSSGCAAGETDAVSTVYAPKGAVSYEWYRSKTGILIGESRQSDNSYVVIDGATDDSLGCTADHFRPIGLDTMYAQNTFMCKITTQMNSTYSEVSKLFIDVANTKPVIVVDSTKDCDGNVTLTDLSYTPIYFNDSSLVDTSATQWRFYTSYPPTEQTLVGTYIGGTAQHTYETRSTADTPYSVKVRTTAFGRSCWNEKTFPIHAIKRPVAQVQLSPDTVLHPGDTVTITDLSDGAVSRQWTITPPDTTFESTSAEILWQLDTTTTVSMHTTDGDGCSADTTFIINVEEIPVNIAQSSASASLRIYPNPTSGIVTIEADNVVKIEVLDVAGRSIVAAEGTNTIDLSTLAGGTYLLHVTTSHGVTTRKITKTK